MRLRLFALCFIATHMPLLGYLLWGLSTGRIALAEFVLLTLATVIGTAIALLGIGAMLSPIQTLAETLHKGEVAPGTLPEMGDVIQTLYAGVQRTASATQARIDDLHNAAHEDMLTGVANRRGFLTQINQLPIDRRKGCVALIDIDYFKRVNDQMGHDEGDRVLRAFAARLSAQLRRMDIVARWGGEEFAIFFQDCIEDEVSWSLARVASRMRSDPIGLVAGRPISFSAGICRWKGDELEDALRRADAALYEAKQAGRDRICRAAPLLQEV
nr:GGDEF domain-containing protein [Sphingobium lactosutens]